jgi:hypothetical protein
LAEEVYLGVMMADQNMVDFYGRVSRIKKARAKGYGFEAAGTLGRSFYTQHAQPRTKFSILKPALIVLIGAFGLKGAIHYQIGGNVYSARVAELKAGEGFDRIGGYLMQADPVTMFVSAKLKQTIGVNI